MEMWGQFEFVLLSLTLVWFTPLGLPGWCGGRMHQHLASGKRRRRRWHSICWHMAQCEGVGWLLWWFALVTKNRDISERNVTLKCEIWAMNICSLGFQGIRECVTLWRLIVEFRVYTLIRALPPVALNCIMDALKLSSMVFVIPPSKCHSLFLIPKPWGMDVRNSNLLPCFHVSLSYIMGFDIKVTHQRILTCMHHVVIIVIMLLLTLCDSPNATHYTKSLLSRIHV